MNTPDETLATLRSFFEDQPPFSEAAELTAHASSGKPEVFLRWFTSLSAPDRDITCHTLTDRVLFGYELDDYLPQAAFLLAELAVKHPSSFSPSSITALENYVKRGDIASSWLEDRDNEANHLKDYRSRWCFALSLWNILYVLKSSVALERFHVFTSRAKDPEFIRALKLAKKVRDNPFGSSLSEPT